MPQETLLSDPLEQSHAPQSSAARTALRLRLGTPSEFAALRGLFEKAGYTEAGICARGNCATVPDLNVPDQSDDNVLRDALDVLLRLFMDGQQLPRSQVQEQLSHDGVELLEGFGLLAGDPTDSDSCYAPLALYPLYGLYLVSDQSRTLGAPMEEVPVDVVYSALPSTTSEFMQSLPNTACDSLLDIGTGTGVAALYAASHYARQAWAVDITERSVRVCEFNARMNAIENVSVRKGDLYQPVADQTFDRIVAHPPYMPALDSRLIFRDGGEDGEQLTRRIIQGLPDRLRPGGRFCCRTLATDRATASLQHRLRDLLGPAQDEFDVVLVTNLSIPPARFYFRLIAGGGMTAVNLDQQIQVFERLGVESVVIGFVSIERHSQPKKPVTVRRHMESGGVPLPATVDWLINWERTGADPDLPNRLRAARPRVSPHAQIKLVHQMRDGQLRANAGSVTTEFPFSFTMDSSPGLVVLLAHCDGSRTVDQLHDEMRKMGSIPPNTPIEEFLQFSRHLIGGGVLEIDEFRLPSS